MQFMASGVFGRVGAGGMNALVKRQYADAPPYTITLEVAAALPSNRVLLGQHLFTAKNRVIDDHIRIAVTASRRLVRVTVQTLRERLVSGMVRRTGPLHVNAGGSSTAECGWLAELVSIVDAVDARVVPGGLRGSHSSKCEKCFHLN